MSDKIGSVLFVGDALPKQEMKQLSVAFRTVFPAAFDGGLQTWWNDPLMSLITKGLGSTQRIGDQVYVHRVTARVLSKHRWLDDYAGTAAEYQPCYWQHDLFLKTNYETTSLALQKMSPAEIYAIPVDLDPSTMGPLYPLALLRATQAEADEKFSLLSDHYVTKPDYKGGEVSYTTPIVPPLPEQIVTIGSQAFGGGAIQVADFKTSTYEFEFRKPMLVKYDPTKEEEFGFPVPDRELFFNHMICMPGVKLENMSEFARITDEIHVVIIFSDVPILPETIRQNPAAVVDDQDFWAAAEDERPDERSEEEASLKRARAGRAVFWNAIENRRPRKRTAYTKKRRF